MKSIFITGTSSGIGKSLCEEFSINNQVYGFSRKVTNIKNGKYWQGDMRDEKFIESIIFEIENIDYLIINAGVGYFGKFEEIDEEKNREILDTNLLFPTIFIHKLLKNKKVKKGIIFIGSYAGKKSMRYGACYMVSKFGLRGLAMGLKNETSLGIHIINPKIVATNFHKKSTVDVSSLPHTEMKEILNVVGNIIEGKETRFEIDL